MRGRISNFITGCAVGCGVMLLIALEMLFMAISLVMHLLRRLFDLDRQNAKNSQNSQNSQAP